VFFIRLGAVTLRLPEGFRQALYHAMFRIMGVTCFDEQALVNDADAGRPVDSQLLAQTDMHAHVKKRVGLSRFRQVVPVDDGILVGKQRMIFRMLLDDLGNQAFHGFQGPVFQSFLPGFEVEAAELIAVVVE